MPPTAMRHLGIAVDPDWEWEAEAFGFPPYRPANLSAVPDPRLGSVEISWSPRKTMISSPNSSSAMAP